MATVASCREHSFAAQVSAAHRPHAYKQPAPEPQANCKRQAHTQCCGSAVMCSQLQASGNMHLQRAGITCACAVIAGFANTPLALTTLLLAGWLPYALAYLCWIV
jgi:hypothetical protein